MTIDLGGGTEEDSLNFVRARAPLLMAWEEARAPTSGFAEAFVECGVPVEDSLSSVVDSLLQRLHHSSSTVILDQLLIVLPLVVVGSWQLLAQQTLQQAAQYPLICMLALLYGALLCARLMYLGLMD